MWFAKARTTQSPRGESGVPGARHSEINEYSVQAIMKDLADQRGEGWWRP
jgi:hypothetical protein